MTKITKSVATTREAVVAYKCDHCGKEERQLTEEELRAYDGPGRWQERREAYRSRPSERWHTMSSHHSDWGNDSVDSWEHQDLCSAACYVAVLKREIATDSETTEIDGINAKFWRQIVAQLEGEPGG